MVHHLAPGTPGEAAAAAGSVCAPLSLCVNVRNVYDFAGRPLRMPRGGEGVGEGEDGGREKRRGGKIEVLCRHKRQMVEKGKEEGRGGERAAFEETRKGESKQRERQGVEEWTMETGGGGGGGGVLSEQFDPARTCAHVLLPVVLLYWGVGGEIGL